MFALKSQVGTDRARIWRWLGDVALVIGLPIGLAIVTALRVRSYGSTPAEVLAISLIVGIVLTVIGSWTVIRSRRNR